MIRRNKIYSYDNGFDEVCIALTLEDEDKNYINHPSLESYDIIDVLMNNKIMTVSVDCLFELRNDYYEKQMDKK